MTFKTYLKSKLKYLMGVASLAAIVSQLLMPVGSTQAAQPRFNFLSGDYEMIRGVNYTQNETVWKNPVSGTVGDEFRGIVYYHNGVLNTTAENTRIKINIPGSTTNNSAKITGSISADNAETVTATVVDGQIVGRDGLIVNLNQDANLEFVPGSVKWFPEGSKTSVTLPFGQSGNEIVSGNGLNIGGINGCWEFAGYVSFGFKTKAKITPSTLTVSKTVKNVTAGETNFIEQTNAARGDEVLYHIDVNTSGSEPLENVIVKDELPSGVGFVSGSLVKITSGGKTTISDSDAAKFFDGGLNIGTISGGNTRTSFEFKAKVANNAPEGCLTNKAIATAGSLSASDIAKVCVVAPNIVKQKTAFNVTKNEPAAIANPGDVIEYTLITKNTGSAPIANFVVEDDINRVLAYSDIVSISDSGQVVTENGAKIVRYAPVTINPGQTVTRKFTVKVVNPLPTSPSELKLINVYGNEVVIIIKRPPVPPSMTISKYVRNVTTGESNFVKSNQAFAGDVLEYRINFTNNGTVPVDQVKIYDVLPANTQYISGTTVISRNGATEQTLPDGIVAGGVTLDTVPVGESDYIKFRVTTSTGLASGQKLVNTGYLQFDKKTLSDTAETLIIAKGTTPVKTTPVLPKTGPYGAGAAAGGFLAAFTLGIAFLYLKYRRDVILPQTRIIDNLFS